VLPRLIELLFPARQGERRLTAILFIHGLLVVGTFVAGRTVRDSLFLAHSDQEGLAWMYVLSSIAVAGVGLAYRPFAVRLRRERVAVGSSIIFAALFMVFWFLEPGHRTWVYAALYIYVEALGAIAVMQFWMLVNDLFHSREARRLYGVIGAGGTASNIVAGFATMKIAASLGARALLVLCALLSLGAAASAWIAGSSGQDRIVERTIGGQLSGRARPSALIESAHLRWIALLTVITFFTTTLVDFQFKVAAGAQLHGDELAVYFGKFYLVIGSLTLLLQLFGTSELLKRGGVVGALALLPVSLATGSLGMILLPGLGTAAASKGADALLRYSINEPATQILYLPVAPQLRVAAKAFIEGMVKPTAIALCGLALVAYCQYLRINPAYLAWGGLALALAWAAVVSGLRPRYLRSLEGSLRQRRLNLDVGALRTQDGTAKQVLSQVLREGDPSEVLHALQLLPQLEDLDLDHQVEFLLEHTLPEIRIASLEYFRRRETMRFANSIFRRFEDPDAKVRAAAVGAFCAIGRDRAVKNVRPFLSDVDPDVRGAAITGMIRFGGLDGVLAAGEALKLLLNDPEPQMRETAARVLGAVGVKTFYPPILELMKDPDRGVRRQAIWAAGQLQSPELATALISCCGEKESGREASDALVCFGAGVIPRLAKVLDSTLEDPAARRGAAMVLGRIGGTDALEAVLGQINAEQEDLRTEVHRSLARAGRRVRLGSPQRKRVRDGLLAEVQRAYQLLLNAEVLELGASATSQMPYSGPKAASALLSSALVDKLVQTERRIFMLLGVLHSDPIIEPIRAGIQDPGTLDGSRRRANAIELLENILSKPLRRVILPLFDDLARVEKIRAASDLLTLTQRSPPETVVGLCRDQMAWVRACAIYYAAEHQMTGVTEALIEACRDAHPIVRETALLGCARLAPKRAQEIAQALLQDEAPMVRRRATLMAGYELAIG